MLESTLADACINVYMHIIAICANHTAAIVASAKNPISAIVLNAFMLPSLCCLLIKLLTPILYAIRMPIPYNALMYELTYTYTYVYINHIHYTHKYFTP